MKIKRFLKQKFKEGDLKFFRKILFKITEVYLKYLKFQKILFQFKKILILRTFIKIN